MSDQEQSVRGSAAGVVLFLLAMMASWLLYTLDPWIGLIAGGLVIVYAIGLLLTNRSEGREM